MKTIAFAGSHPVLKALVTKYIGTKVHDDVANHIMRNGEQLKILISRDPWDPQPNRYQWASRAERIFVCENADDADFIDNVLESIRAGRFHSDDITVVGHARNLDLNVLTKLQEFSYESGYSLIFCSIDTNEAYLIRDNHTYHEDIITTLDMVIEHSTEINIEEDPELEEIPPRRRKCSIM